MIVALFVGGCAAICAGLCIDPLGGKDATIARPRTRREARRSKRNLDRFMGV